MLGRIARAAMMMLFLLVRTATTYSKRKVGLPSFALGHTFKNACIYHIYAFTTTSISYCVDEYTCNVASHEDLSAASFRSQRTGRTESNTSQSTVVRDL